jgi:hypothetical protein
MASAVNRLTAQSGSSRSACTIRGTSTSSHCRTCEIAVRAIARRAAWASVSPGIRESWSIHGVAVATDSLNCQRRNSARPRSTADPVSPTVRGVLQGGEVVLLGAADVLDEGVAQLGAAPPGCVPLAVSAAGVGDLPEVEQHLARRVAHSGQQPQPPDPLRAPPARGCREPAPSALPPPPARRSRPRPHRGRTSRRTPTAAPAPVAPSTSGVRCSTRWPRAATGGAAPGRARRPTRSSGVATTSSSRSRLPPGERPAASSRASGSPSSRRATSARVCRSRSTHASRSLARSVPRSASREASSCTAAESQTSLARRPGGGDGQGVEDDQALPEDAERGARVRTSRMPGAPVEQGPRDLRHPRQCPLGSSTRMTACSLASASASWCTGSAPSIGNPLIDPTTRARASEDSWAWGSRATW